MLGQTMFLPQNHVDVVVPQRRWRDAMAHTELAIELGAQCRDVVGAAEVRAAIATDRREVRDIIVQRIEVEIE